MPRYFFQLGNTPKLSLLELEKLITTLPKLITPQLATATFKDELDTKQLQQRAGGLVKIFQELLILQTNSINEVESKIVDYLASLNTPKVIFSISNLGVQPCQLKPINIKKKLKARQIKARYLETKENSLSAAILLHQNVIELVMINTGTELIFTKTVSVQNIDDWTKRDRQKPYANHKKGMLPPKVARIMVNLANSHLPAKDKPLLYDPFCGSGTILMEGLLSGYKIFGSDIDFQAVTGTQQNLAWLIQEYNLDSSFSVIHHDATQVLATDEKIDLIVTEPFLGKLTPKDNELPNIFKGLYRTYLGAFKNWTKKLKPGAPVVIIFPLVKTKNRTYSLNKLIDKLSDLGYTTDSKPVIYSRPQAIIKRQINFLRYKG